MENHYALIGMASIVDDQALYAEAVNEKGLGMAGLNFPGNAEYFPFMENKDNITPYEFIPWILGQCSNVAQARELLSNINLLNIPFMENLPLAPLHWMIADKNEAIVVENAPLGVRSGVNAGIFTIAVNTGPLPDEALLKEGANLLFHSMEDFNNNWENFYTAIRD